MRSDISVCGSDEEEDFHGNDEYNDDQEAIVLTESRILKDADYELSDFDGG